VPSLVRGIAAAARAASVAASPALLYRATMLTLFRTLFVLYAEDRNLLPVDHPEYRLHSLTSRVPGLRQSAAAGRFDARATSLWADMRQIFTAVADGHREWGVPAYDGGLFVDDPATSEEGAFLARIQLTNEYFGPALHGLAVDTAADDSGKVDFGALGVRHIGNLYEGLLSYEVAIADGDDPPVEVGETDGPRLRAPRGSVGRPEQQRDLARGLQEHAHVRYPQLAFGPPGIGSALWRDDSERTPRSGGWRWLIRRTRSHHDRCSNQEEHLHFLSSELGRRAPPSCLAPEMTGVD